MLAFGVLRNGLEYSSAVKPPEFGTCCVSAPNWDPTLKDDNLLKLNANMPG